MCGSVAVPESYQSIFNASVYLLAPTEPPSHPSPTKSEFFFVFQPHPEAPEGVFRVPPLVWINKGTGEESVSLIKAALKGISLNFPFQL